MASFAPVVSRRKAGSAAHAAPAASRRQGHEQQGERLWQVAPDGERHADGADGADEQLALAAEVEQAGSGGDDHGEGRRAGAGWPG